MIAFIAKRAPKSHNSNRRQKYQDAIGEIFDSNGFKDLPLTGKLYARIYYFHKGEPKVPDADNISKPIMDALKDHAYDDDSIVIHRTAARLDRRTTDLKQLSVTDMTDSVLYGSLMQSINIRTLSI